jgi:DNA-binding MarR family transcriptional regulator
MTPNTPNGRRTRTRGHDAPIADGLANLGLTDYEVRVYLAILRHPNSRVPEIARHSQVPQPKVYSTLKRLTERGLCESLLGSVNSYAALPPTEAFRPLLEDMRARDTQTKDALTRLRDEFKNSGAPLNRREGRVKLFKGKHAAGRNYKFLLNASDESVKVIARLPLVVSDDHEIMRERTEKGVEILQLYELPEGPQPEMMEVLADHSRGGAKMRWIAEVPMRLVIFDRRITGLPMVDPQPGEGDGFTMLEIRNQRLSEGFCGIFEMIWQQATDIVI